MEQRSQEWHDARAGKMTCSRMAEAVGMIGSRRRLWRELTGRERGIPTTERMQDGITYEGLALSVYAEAMQTSLVRPGFLMHRDIDWIGGSPDALAGMIIPSTFKPEAPGELMVMTGVEAKCPARMFLDMVPDYYMPQIQGLMEICDTPWWDFMVWTPDEYRIARVWRSTEYWQELYELLAEFWAFVESDVEPPAFKRGCKPRITCVDDLQIRLLCEDKNGCYALG